jgi:hypothetical protein
VRILLQGQLFLKGVVQSLCAKDWAGHKGGGREDGLITQGRCCSREKDQKKTNKKTQTRPES